MRHALRTATLIYDGDCRVCTRMAHAISRWDRHHAIDVVPSQAPGVRDRFPWIAAAAYDRSLQLVEPDGTTWEGAAAVERLLDILPRGRAISWIFALPFARAAADRAYRWFARNRYRLDCGDHCKTR